MTYSKWYLVRHGETDWNKEYRAQGHMDTPLNAKGLAQAALVGGRLEPITFAAAYCSDLSRVVATAEQIMQGRDIPLNKMEGLREKSFGKLEGMTFEEIRRRDSALYEKIFQENIHFAPDGGESDLQVHNRVKAVADELLARHANTGDDILVVAHGGSLRALIVCLMGMPTEYMWRLRIGNCGISVVSVMDDGRATLDLLNDTTHWEDVFAKQDGDQ